MIYLIDSAQQDLLVYFIKCCLVTVKNVKTVLWCSHKGVYYKSFLFIHIPRHNLKTFFHG